MSITLIIILITVAASVIAFSSPQLMQQWIFNPYMVYHKRQWWRFFTSGFIHADFIHLAINMLVLYSFGNAVEAYFAEVFGGNAGVYFIFLYLGGMLISSAPTYKKQKHNHLYNSLGASGAVSAILFAAILFNPWSKIYFWGLIGLPGILVGPLYLFYEYRMSNRSEDHINHDAHFWGAVFGVVFPILLQPALALNFFGELLNPK
jgi:membrane associated rhomboid family serine protease